jgi:hypothetical protein
MSRRILIMLCLAMLHPSVRAADIDWPGLVVKAFEETGADLGTIKTKAASYDSVNNWRYVSDADVAMAGGGACIIPVAAYAALPVEFVYLMRQIYNSSMGIGFIITGSAVKEDFANILGVWSGEVKLDEETLSGIYLISEGIAEEVAENAAEKVVDGAVSKAVKLFKAKENAGTTGAGAVSLNHGTQKASAKVVSKVFAEKTGTKVAGKLSTKVAAKTGAKIGAKYAGKAAFAWIPLVSGVVCGGLNIWIMDSILTSAELYFTTMREYRLKRYTPRRNK